MTGILEIMLNNRRWVTPPPPSPVPPNLKDKFVVSLCTPGHPTCYQGKTGPLMYDLSKVYGWNTAEEAIKRAAELKDYVSQHTTLIVVGTNAT